MKFKDSFLFTLRVRFFTQFSLNFKQALLLLLFPWIVMILIIRFSMISHPYQDVQTHYDKIFTNRKGKESAFLNHTDNDLVMTFNSSMNLNPFYISCLREELHEIIVSYQNDVKSKSVEFKKFSNQLIKDIKFDFGSNISSLFTFNIFDGNEDYETANSCFEIYLSDINLTDQTYVLQLYIQDDRFPFNKQYKVYDNLNTHSSYHHQYGNNMEFKAWQMLDKSGYFEISSILLKSILSLLNIYDKQEELQVLFVQSKTPPHRKHDTFQDRQMIFSSAYMIMIFFYMPLLYIVQEMIDDITSHRLQRLQNLGLNQLARLATNIIYTITISLYYSLVTYFMGTISSFHNNQYMFWIVFLYGLTNLGASYILTGFIYFTSLQSNLVLITLIYHSGTMFLSSIFQTCVSDDTSFGIGLLQILFPNLALRQGTHSILANPLYKNSGIIAECISQHPSSAVYRLIFSIILISQLGIFIRILARSQYAESLKIQKQFSKIGCCKRKCKEEISKKDYDRFNTHDDESHYSMMTLFNSTNKILASKLEKIDHFARINGTITKNKKEINETFYEQQITFITGSNGSGKEEFIKNLLGITNKPMLKYLKLYNIDEVFLHQQEYQQILGFCHEIDTLIPNLTIIDFIHLQCKLKSLETQEYENQIQELINILRLEDCAHKITSSLTNSQQHKLKILLALLGQPKFLVLDFSRYLLDYQSLQKLLQYLILVKREKIILLLDNDTKIMEKVSDRILSFRNGVPCCHLNADLMFKFQPFHFVVTVYNVSKLDKFLFHEKLENLYNVGFVDQYSTSKYRTFEFTQPDYYYQFVNILNDIDNQSSCSLKFTVKKQMINSFLINQEQSQFSKESYNERVGFFINEQPSELFLISQLGKLMNLIKYNIQLKGFSYFKKQLLYTFILFIIIVSTMSKKIFYQNNFVFTAPLYNERELDMTQFRTQEQKQKWQNTNFYNISDFSSLIEYIDSTNYGRTFEHYCLNNESPLLGMAEQISTKNPKLSNSYIVFANTYADDLSLYKFGTWPFFDYLNRTLTHKHIKNSNNL